MSASIRRRGGQAVAEVAHRAHAVGRMSGEAGGVPGHDTGLVGGQPVADLRLPPPERATAASAPAEAGERSATRTLRPPSTTSSAVPSISRPEVVAVGRRVAVGHRFARPTRQQADLVGCGGERDGAAVLGDIGLLAVGVIAEVRRQRMALPDTSRSGGPPVKGIWNGASKKAGPEDPRLRCGPGPGGSRVFAAVAVHDRRGGAPSLSRPIVPVRVLLADVTEGPARDDRPVAGTSRALAGSSAAVS